MRLIIFLFSILFSTSALAFSDDVEEGSYDCTGYDTKNESNYTAYATINKRGDHYIMTWDIAGNKFEGTGLIHKEEDHIIAFAFKEDAPLKKVKKALKTGIRIYHIDDEILEGTWMLHGQRSINSEKCIKREKW